MRPICDMPYCGVQIPPDQRFCMGHLHLTRVEQRKAEEFLRHSQKLLAKLKAKQEDR